MSDPRTKTTIRIDNLPLHLTSSILHDHFSQFGEITNIELPDPPTSTSSSSHHPDPDPGRDVSQVAHIAYEDPIDAAAAIDNMHHAELFNHVIRVAPAKALREVFEGLGSRVPLWEQEGFIQTYLVRADEETGEGEGEEKSEGGDAMVGLERQLPVAVGPIQAAPDESSASRVGA